MACFGRRRLTNQGCKGANPLTMHFKGAVFLSLLLVIGCAESCFQLSEESRPPKWCDSTGNVSNSVDSVRISYYVRVDGREAVVNCKGGFNKLTGSRFEVTLDGLQPLRLTDAVNGYHSCEIVTLGGVTDVFEHREMGSDVFMTDDQNFLDELGAIEQ